MTARYVALARAPRVWDSNSPELMQDRPTVEVIVTDLTPEPTGLLDAQGVELFRVRERGPMGFKL